MLARLRPRFGWGTLIAVAVAVVLWRSGLLLPFKPPTDMRVVYEADRTGKLRQVEAPSVPPTAPLRIKEPRLLLQHAQALRLTPLQRRRIERIAVQWERGAGAMAGTITGRTGAC